MEGGRSRRPLVIGLVLAVVAAGSALVLVLSGDDDGDNSSASAPTRKTATTEKTVAERTETVTTDTSQAQQQDQHTVEQTVTTFVESAEQSDSQRACAQVAGGSGKQLEDCAGSAGIDLRDLPSSDELQIDSVKVSGDRAKARLSNGSSFSLKQSGGKWKITGFQPSGSQ